MNKFRTKVSVAGFTEDEVRRSIPNLLKELGDRPWFIATDAYWATDRSKLIVAVETEVIAGNNQVNVAEADFDEVWDCVIACMTFSSDRIHFEIEESGHVGTEDHDQTGTNS